MRLPLHSQSRLFDRLGTGEAAMSDQYKTLIAFFVGLSILMFAWSVFKTWELSPPVLSSGVTETAQSSGPSRSVAPTRVAAE
jgi:hypothetical protein